jgi:hypothetical protein
VPNRIRSGVFAIAVCISLTAGGLSAGSCSKKEGPTDPDPGRAPGACGINSSLDKMSAKIDGLDWSSIVTIGMRTADLVNIVGNDGCNPSRVLTFNLTAKGPGTYKVPENEKEEEKDEAVLTAVYSVGTNPGWDAQYPLGKGTVTFSTLNATGATGTFFFTLQPMLGTNGAGTHTVTNGSFDVKFSVLPGAPAGGS